MSEPKQDQKTPLHYDEELVKQIAGICLALRKQADFFMNTEPENLSDTDFDRIAQELELLAQSVDNLLDAMTQEKDSA